MLNMGFDLRTFLHGLNLLGAQVSIPGERPATDVGFCPVAFFLLGCNPASVHAVQVQPVLGVRVLDEFERDRG